MANGHTIRYPGPYSRGELVSPHYARVPYTTRVGDVIGEDVVLVDFLARLPEGPGMVAFVNYGRKVLFMTEYGEDLYFIPVELSAWETFRLARNFFAFRSVWRDLIGTESAAYWWADQFPEDRCLMKQIIRQPEWVEKWNRKFPDDPIVVVDNPE